MFKSRRLPPAFGRFLHVFIFDSLNRAPDATLCITKRKPFDYLAERPFLSFGRGDCRNFEPSPQAIAPFTDLFLGPPEPHLIAVARLMRRSA